MEPPGVQRNNSATQVWILSPPAPHLTCELSQDLFDGDAAGVRVPVGAVGSDQVIGEVDGGLDARCTCFLWGGNET